MNRSLPHPEERAEKIPDEKPFLAHLEELRWTLIRILLAFLCAFAVCVPLTLRGYIIRLLRYPLHFSVTHIQGGSLPDVVLLTLYPGGGFSVAMKVSVEAALVISLPFILYFAGLFILPALTRNERRYFAPVLAGGVLLFYGGITFCYFAVLPFALGFFWKFNSLLGIQNLWTINDYVAFVSTTLLAFGLVFELPLVVLFLVRAGILTYRILSEKRRYAIVLIFVAAAFLTPGPDMVSQILMAIPLLLLYEICVWGAKIMERRKATGRDGETA